MLAVLPFIESATCRKSFDSYRSDIWNNQYVPLHDSTSLAIANGSLTAEQLQLAIARLSNLLTIYKQNYDSNRDKCGADWIDSRFHDFYDPMVRKLTEWQTLASSVPRVTSTVQTAIGPQLPSNGNGNGGYAGSPQFIFGPTGGAEGEPYMPDWMQERETAVVESKPFPWGIALAIGAALLFLGKRGKGT